jgi:Domain of unknown function (DUF3806)
LLALSLSCVGCHRPGTAVPGADGKKMEESIQPATAADRARIAEHEVVVLKLLRARYGDVELLQTEADLGLLQRLSDDGALKPGMSAELESVGIVFGQVVAGRSRMRWITVEWEGQRTLALQYPKTTVIVFPGSMIAKRVDRGERVDFASLLREVHTQVNEMKSDPEYKR